MAHVTLSKIKMSSSTSLSEPTISLLVAASPQLESPLFRVPREIRDAIYDYYTFEENGYFYNTCSEKLALHNGGAIKLDLMYTCRAINAELQGVSLRTNKVTFDCANFQDGPDEGKATSRAGRFNLLLECTFAAKLQMLIYAATCITPTILEKIRDQFGDDGIRLADGFRVVQNNLHSEDADEDVITGTWHTAWRIDPTTGTRDALHRTLELASNHPDFERLASRTFDPSSNTQQRLGWRTYFGPQAFRAVLQWHPLPWAIPTSTELSTLEVHLAAPEEDDSSSPLDYSVMVRPFQWYFSAAAVAIRFLRHHPKERLQMRQIVAREKHRSVSNPESHARGFASVCLENTHLRIKRAIGLWDCMYPASWNDIRICMPGMFLDDDFYRRLNMGNPRFVQISQILLLFARWLGEESVLGTLMPSGSCIVHLEGESLGTYEAWELVRQAASQQHVSSELRRLLGMVKPSPVESDRSQLEIFPLPHHLPDIFPQLIKKITSGESKFIQFQGFSGYPMDLEAELENARTDSLQDRQKQWRKWMSQWVELPEGGMIGLVRRYWLLNGHPDSTMLNRYSKSYIAPVK
ncbi:hypothetical protein BDV96DRAFT_242521 [Lophiotrema nucula]|uniref:Uncharacterized protein n=1 Tax=Lophiotrema nucula TaxID=690887 RepID=A0A6A5YS13_9PLEO|nr:hypothetical protein BDV96DRAFT_242521 [Lophiotrema nucula]